MLLAGIRPYIEKFDSSEYISALASGDVCLVLGYSGDILQARDRAAEAGAGVEVAYTIPKEGASISFDSFVIPRDAPHPEEALAFIDYMMRPDVAARNSNYVLYANGNRDSWPFLDAGLYADRDIYPDEKTMQRLFALRTHDSHAQRTLNRLWAGLKAGT